MNCLLDTHGFLWYVWGDARLPQTARAAIGNPQNNTFVSIVSLWEITIKSSLGKLALDRPLADFWTDRIDGNGFLILPVERDHLLVLAGLPLYHRDPFDRLIVAQNITEAMPLITGDASIQQYPVTTLW